MNLRAPLLLALVAAVAALETPLTFTSGTRVVMVDPALGSITAYEVTQSKSDRVGLGKANGNFVADADLLIKYCQAERDGIVFQAIRLGSPNNKPGYGDVLAPKSPLLADKPTRKDIAAGKPALITRVMQAENAFWKANPTYDGKVSVALSSSGQYLAVALQSLHALMIYKMDNDAATLVAWHNWGPELFVQVGFNTPNPADELARLPLDKKKQALAILGLDEETKPDAGAPPPPPVTVDEPPTPKSEIWLGATQGDSFLVVDLANQRAMLYQFNGKDLTLNSVRNLAFDMILPGLVEGSVKSSPSGEAMLAQFVSTRKSHIQAFGLLTDIDSVSALVGQRQAAAKNASEFEAVVTGPVAFLNFSKNRVFLSLDTAGGQRLALTAARDYTLDTAIGLLDQEILDRTNARNKLKEVATLAKTAPKAGLLTLRLVLSLDPRLHKAAETAIKGAYKGEQQAEAQALIDEAVKKADDLAKETEARKKAAEERKKAREALGK